MDIQVSSNFERLLFEAAGRDAPAPARTDGGPRPIRPLRARRHRACGGPLRVRRRRGRTRVRSPRRSAASGTRRRYLLDPHSAIGVAAARKARRDPATPMVALGTAHPAKFPDAVEAASGVRPALPAPSRRPPASVRSGSPSSPTTRPAWRRSSGSARGPRRSPRHERRGHAASIRPHRRHRRHRRISRRPRSASGPGPARARKRRGEHGLAHLLEHMAFKGTRRRDARRIAEEIETAGGELNAATSVEHTAYYARVLKDDVVLGLDILADILTELGLRRARADREKNVILQEIGAVEDTPDDLVFDLFGETAFAGQPIGRRILGTPETVVELRRPAPSALPRRPLPRARTWSSRRPAPSTMHASSMRPSRLFSEPAGRTPAPADRARRLQGRGDGRASPTTSRPIVLIGFEGRSYRHPDTHAAECLRQRARRRHVLAAVPGGAGEARPLLLDLRLPVGLCRYRHLRRLRGRQRGGPRRAGAGRSSTRSPPPPITRRTPRSPGPRRR